MDCELNESEYMLEYHFDLHKGHDELPDYFLGPFVSLQSYPVFVSEIKTWA